MTQLRGIVNVAPPLMQPFSVRIQFRFVGLGFLWRGDKIISHNIHLRKCFVVRGFFRAR